MSDLILMAIQQMLSTLPNECEIYGIGSFFEGLKKFRDVDLVIVTSDSSTPAYSTSRFRQSALQAGRELDISFDITVFTRSEFARKPLRNTDKLVLLART